MEPPATPPAEEATAQELEELYDNPLERLQLLAGDDTAIAACLDEIDVRSPREREMLEELARPGVLARPDRLELDHRRLVAALESLRRHGYHGSRAGAPLGRMQPVVRFFVELVARYVVVSYVKTISTELRNLYWLREIEAADGSDEEALLQRARADAHALVEITRSRELGIPTFVLAGSSSRQLCPSRGSRAASRSSTGGSRSSSGSEGSRSASRSPGSSSAARRWRAGGSGSRSRSRSAGSGSPSGTVGVWIALPLLVTLSLAT